MHFVADKNHTLFVYMEDDLELTWPALQAWAYDESLLAPRGFHRGFVRVEVAQWDGKMMAFDQTERLSVASDDSPIMAFAAEVPAEHTHLSGNTTASFVRLQSSYMAMWLASRSQLAEWFRAPQWSAALNGHHDMIREDAAWNLYTIKRNHFRRQKHKYSLLVPYDPSTATVAKIAMLPHLSNTYCSREAHDAEVSHPFCKIRFEDIISQS